jgi:hypothetical protein
MSVSMLPRLPGELWAIYLHLPNRFVEPNDDAEVDAILTWTTKEAADDGLKSQLAADYVTTDMRPMVVRVK